MCVVVSLFMSPLLVTIIAADIAHTRHSYADIVLEFIPPTKDLAHIHTFKTLQPACV